MHATWRNGLNAAARNRSEKMDAQPSMHLYEVRPRKDKRGVDLISDALPFGRLWYGESDAIGYARVLQPLTRRRIRVCDEAGNVDGW